MAQCDRLNVRLSNSQLNKSKSEMKNYTEVILNLSSNVTGGSNDEINFLTNCYYLIKFQGFVKLLQVIHKLI